MKNKGKAVIRVVLLALVAGVIGFGVYQLNANRLTGDAVPMPFGVGVAVVLSGSMEPELSRGDLLLVAEREQYALDQIVVFQDGRTPVVHRIIKMDGDTVTTMGDANPSEDTPIDVSNIKGEVVLALPLIGYLVLAIKTPIGILAVLGLALWLMERSFRKEKDSKQEQLKKIRQEIEQLKKQQEDSKN